MDYYYFIIVCLENVFKNMIFKGLIECEVVKVLYDILEKVKLKYRFVINKDWFNIWFLFNILLI